MISNELIKKECDVLRKSIKKKQRFVDEAPEGFLRCRKNKNHYNWFVVLERNFDGKNGNEDGFQNEKNYKTESNFENRSEDNFQNKNEENSKKKIEKYIQKSDEKLAQKMALKGLYEQDLLDEKQELAALEMFLKKRSKFERRGKYLSRSDGILELVDSRLNSKWSADVEAWLNEHVEFNVPNPEGRKYRCKNGMTVRSKSEQIIVSALLEHDVPFKYEEPIYLGTNLYCPDFTVMNARTGKEYVWEHFGMMDNPEYLERNIKKINKYIEHGYIPFVNFLMTFEINNSGVDDMWIERIIENFLK